MFSGARSVQSSIIRGNTRALSSGETFNALVEAVSQTCVKALTTASSWLFKFANCLAHSTISYKISDVVSANYKKNVQDRLMAMQMPSERSVLGRLKICNARRLRFGEDDVRSRKRALLMRRSRWR